MRTAAMVGAQQRYRVSEKGKATQRRYHTSEKGRAARKRASIKYREGKRNET